MEILSEIERIASSLKKNAYSDILKMWKAGKPIEGIELEEVEGLLIEPEVMKLIIEEIENTVSEYGNTGIYCVVGEAGSGKSQIALFALERFKNKMNSRYFRVNSWDSIDKIGKEMEKMKGNNIVFIDELDSLLGSLSEEEREKAIEKLENMLILHAEEPKEDGRIAAILLLNRRSYNLIKKRGPRLGRRMIELKLGIPLDYERLPPDKFTLLARIVIAVIYAAKRELFPTDYAADVMRLLADWSESYREKILGSASVGTCLKEILRTYLRILENLEFKPMDKTEEGNKVEEVFRKLFSRHLQNIKFDSEGRRYVASLVQSKGPGADLLYTVYPGEIPSGKPVKVVNIEIKCGHYSSLRERRDQLIKYGQQGPLLIIWIYKEEPDKLEELISQVEGEIPNPVDYISLPYELIRPAIYMKDPEIFMRELRIKEDLEDKLQESLKYIEISAKPPALVKDVQQECKEAAQKLVQRIKPDEKDGKNIQLGRVADYLSDILSKLGIQVDESRSEAIARKVLSELEKQEFFERRKKARGESKIFYSKLNAWKMRRNDAINLISNILIEELK